MIVADVNLLVYATIGHMPQHARARAWLSEVLATRGHLALCAVSVFGFIRVSTNRRAFESPRSVPEALSDVRSWLQAGAVWLTPGPRHLEATFGLLEKIGTAGNLTTDAQLAALALEHHAELHSADNDFARFPGLRWANPLA